MSLNEYTSASAKGAAIQRINSLSLPTPTSLSVTAEHPCELQALLREFPDATWIPRGEGAGAPPLLHSSEILPYLETKDIPSRLLITKRIPELRSGLLFRGKDFLYVEHVRGPLKPLLRQGTEPHRYLLEADGSEPIASLKPESGWLPNVFQQFSSNFPLFSLFEWIQDEMQNVYFVDIKNTPTDFLVNGSALQFGLRNGILFSLPLPLQGKIAWEIRSESILLATRPELDKFWSIPPKPKGAVFRQGGLLSHLVFRFAQNGIPSIVSRSYYLRAKREGNINTTPQVQPAF